MGIQCNTKSNAAVQVNYIVSPWKSDQIRSDQIQPNRSNPTIDFREGGYVASCWLATEKAFFIKKIDEFSLVSRVSKAQKRCLR